MGILARQLDAKIPTMARPNSTGKLLMGTVVYQFQNVPLIQSQGQVYINGIAMTDATVQDWYAHKIGYVLQLAVPYYEELTVRQNLFFAAHMRLPKSMSHVRKFERVEQILAEVFKLFNFAKFKYKPPML